MRNELTTSSPADTTPPPQSFDIDIPLFGPLPPDLVSSRSSVVEVRDSDKGGSLMKEPLGTVLDQAVNESTYVVTPAAFTPLRRQMARMFDGFRSIKQPHTVHESAPHSHYCSPTWHVHLSTSEV